MDSSEKRFVECLAAAHGLETTWAYFQQSDGQLFAEEARKGAGAFVEALDTLLVIDPKAKDPKELALGNSDVDDIIQALRTWATDTRSFPYESAAKSRFMMFGLLAGLRGYITRKLQLDRFAGGMLTTREGDFTERTVRWKGHLPQRALRSYPDKIVQDASKSQTVVVMADIRRSQDLMTYSANPQDFSERMVNFVNQTRGLIAKYGGFFDKFTGDGFLAYFNQTICGLYDGADHINCFLTFVKEAQAFYASHFYTWCKSVRKLPSLDVGVAIGADVGRVEFVDLHHHLVAVGEPIVWASRMASAGKANEVIINNLLFTALEKSAVVNFEPFTAQTKSGESFLARRMKFTIS